jgi:hypothetical protein
MSRIYDASQLTIRRGERAIAGSFLTPAGNGTNPSNVRGSRPYLGITSQSIINAVRTGHMTEYTRYDTCIGISPGCPCPQTNASVATTPYVPAIPGQVTGITFTVGSIIVSWNAPTTGDGPFTYTVTPYLNGIAQLSVTTTATTYRFTNLIEGQSYTFSICAANAAGQGGLCPSGSVIAPPEELSVILAGSNLPIDVAPSLMYIMNVGLDNLLNNMASTGTGPTISSRLMYLWVASVAQAWNWVCSDSRVAGIHDGWNWDWNPTAGSGPRGITLAPLTDCDCIIWTSKAIDYITPFIVSSAPSCTYNYSATDVTRVQAAGQWDAWKVQWASWLAERNMDGSAAARTTMPVAGSSATMPVSATPVSGSANWIDTTQKTIVVNQVSTDIQSFPEPHGWSRLTINGNMQRYATWLWDTVRSTCLTPANEQDITMTVGAPLANTARDVEIDEVKTIAANLTDAQKIQAEFWAGSSPGTISPPLMSIWLWKEYMRCSSVACPALIFSLLDLSIHMFEGGRVTWGLKGLYMQDRPIQEIRRRYTGQQISSWNGLINGGQWVPYQPSNFVTPPFPDFPSGHSNFTKGFALTMTKWFGADIVKTTTTYDKLPLMTTTITSNQTAPYGDFTISTGASSIQPGVTPAVPVVFSFTAWDQMADAAGMSRIYGGIHTENANAASKISADLTHVLIDSTWNIRATQPLAAVPVFNEIVQPDADAASIDDLMSQPIAPAAAAEPAPANQPLAPEAPTEPEPEAAALDASADQPEAPANQPEAPLEPTAQPEAPL